MVMGGEVVSGSWALDSDVVGGGNGGGVDEHSYCFYYFACATILCRPRVPLMPHSCLTFSSLTRWRPYALQKGNELVFLKTPKDRAVFKFMMGACFLVTAGVFVGIQNMATGTNKATRS